MGGDPTNPYPVGVNIAAGATMYSTLAGIMCGFAFTAIVLLVVTWLAESSRAQRVLAATGRALVASFFGLLIMSVLYAAESAGAYSWGQSISENVILADGFDGVGILLIYAIVLMLETADETTDPPSARGRDLAIFARAFACVLNLLILGLAYEAAGDYETIRYGLSHSITGIDVLAWSLLGIECAVTLGSLWVITVRHDAGGKYEEHRPATSQYLVYAGLGLPVTAAVAYVVVDNALSETDTIPPALVALVLALSFAVTCAATLQLTLTRPSQGTSRSRRSTRSPWPSSAPRSNGSGHPRRR